MPNAYNLLIISLLLVVALPAAIFVWLGDERRLSMWERFMLRLAEFIHGKRLTPLMC